MTSDTILAFSGLVDTASRDYAQSLAQSPVNQGRKRGWAVHISSAGETLRIRVNGAPPEILRKCVEAFAVSAAARGLAFSTLQTDVPTTKTGSNTQEGEIVWGSVFQSTLTRDLLRRLPQGAFIVSGGYSQTGGRLFAEQIGSIRERDTQWQRAKAAGASGRRCRIVWCWADFAAISD